MWRLPVGTITAVTLATLAAVAPLSAAEDFDCNDRYTGPSTGRVIAPPPMVPKAPSGFDIAFDGDGVSVIRDSIRYHVNGPMGALELRAERPEDGETGTAFTPTKEGHYIVSATWTRYDCKDIGRQTTAAGAAPEVGFEVVHGKDPGGTYWTTKRRRRSGWGHVLPGDAALHVGPKCPPDEIATKDPLRIDLYWTTNGRSPTHRSRHVGVRSTQGCWGGRSVRTRDFRSKSVNAGASGVHAFIDAFEPAFVKVLAEIHSGDRLVYEKHATIKRSRTGMKVVARF
jgi:hypothetical protein